MKYKSGYNPKQSMLSNLETFSTIFNMYLSVSDNKKQLLIIQKLAKRLYQEVNKLPDLQFEPDYTKYHYKK